MILFWWVASFFWFYQFVASEGNYIFLKWPLVLRHGEVVLALDVPGFDPNHENSVFRNLLLWSFGCFTSAASLSQAEHQCGALPEPEKTAGRPGPCVSAGPRHQVSFTFTVFGHVDLLPSCRRWLIAGCVMFLPQTRGRTLHVWLWNQWNSPGRRTGGIQSPVEHEDPPATPLTATHFSSPQRKEAVALHVRLLDLSNEFLVGSHMPNRIARSAIPEHLHLQFASEGSFIQVGGLHADSPDDLVGDWDTSSFCSAGGAIALY